MTHRLLTRTNVVFAILVLITCFSWETVQSTRSQVIPHGTGVVAMVMAFIKVRFIMMDFMEIRHAPLLLRIAAQAWIAIVGLGVIGFLLAGPMLLA